MQDCCPSLTASLEPLAHWPNVASLGLFYRWLVDINLNWLNWFHFLILKVGLLVILIDCMILCHHSKKLEGCLCQVCFLAQLDSRIPCLQNPFLWLMISAAFKSRISRHLFNCRFFLNRFPVCFNLFVLLILVPPCLAVSVTPCME